MSKTAILFPGQGSQSVGMLAELAAREPAVEQTFAEASDVLDMDLWEVVSAGPEERLNRTEITQPAMLAADIACWRVLNVQFDTGFDYFAGHSLGEYAALVAAGAIDFAAAIDLVAARGRAMQNAVPEGQGAMAAIIGMDDADVRKLCEQVAEGEVLAAANYNSPGQVVIAGHTAAVDRACEQAKPAGARLATKLPVSVPSHCELMREASAELGPRLQALKIQSSSVPVIHNADVTSYTDAAQVRDALARQLFQPVRWTETIEYLAARGVEQMYECGPGKVLTGLVKRIDRSLDCQPLNTPEAFDKLG